MKIGASIARGLRRIAARFEAAESSTARSSYFSPVQSPVRDAAPATRQKLIAKSRDLYNNHAIFCAIIERLVSYTVGTGFTVSPNSSDEKFNAAAAKVWRRFADMPEFASRRNFLSLQTVLARSMFVDGDVFTVHTYDELFNPKWQIFEGYRITDRVNCDWDKPDGVVLDALGRPVSYNLALDDDMMNFRTLPACAVVRYSFDKRPNQYRGLPIMHAAITTILDVKEIVDYEKQSVKYSSSLIGAVNRASGEIETDAPGGVEGVKRLKSGADASLKQESEEAVLEWYERQKASTLIVSKPGEEVKINATDRPGPAWQGFMTYLVESACLATGLTPSIVLGTKVGGADTRAVLATAERIIIPWQDALCDIFQLEYEWIMEEAIVRGELENPPDDWYAAIWHRPTKPTVDAGRVSNQEREDVKAGLMSREQFFSARGLDYRRELRQQAIEAKYILELSEQFGVSPELIDANFKGATAGGEAEPSARLAQARCKPGQCPHKWGRGGGFSPKRGGGNGEGGKRAKYGELAEKLVKSSDAMRRINNPKGETIAAADGKPAVFNAQSVKHVKFDHKGNEGIKRMSELAIAQDTTATGKHFESLNKGKKQTEFIKEYNIGGKKKYFYTARRGKNSVVYSWHTLNENQYARKLAEWEKSQKGGAK